MFLKHKAPIGVGLVLLNTLSLILIYASGILCFNTFQSGVDDIFDIFQSIKHSNALWVRLNVKREIGKFLPHPSFYPCPNISDRFPPQASHFIRIQIFQIYIFRRRDEHFSISISHLHAKETFVNQLRKEKGTS